MNLNKIILIFVINLIALNGERITQTVENCGLIYENTLYNRETIAKSNEYPWTVLIGFGTRDDGIDYKCQGALLSRRIVITANHCTTFEGYNITEILVGDWTSNVHIEQQIYGVDEYINNPDFDPYLYVNDIALLHLDREVIFGPHVQPICLPPTDYTHDNIITKQLYFTGMEKLGNPKRYQLVKHKKFAHIISPFHCANTFGILGNLNFEKQLCGLTEEEPVLLSGASLMDVKTVSSLPKYMFLVGIATFGTNRDSNFVGFASIIPHVGWLKRYIRLAD